MRRVVILFVISVFRVFCDDGFENDFMSPAFRNSKDEVKVRTVKTESGLVAGEKYWNGDFYEFYGIPYATVPKGRDRFKGSLPAEKWDGVFEANQNRILCPQSFYTGDETEEIYLAGEEDCLILNLLVPEVASEKNLVPVILYIHSGAFAVGNSNMAKFHYLARHDVIVGSFNFRLGAVGFNCLGTEDIPGNAGMKDAVAGLRWVNRNINKFGGDPNKVTLAGFSVGATMAELLALSKATDGLIDKLILESGSALNPYAVNRDPISTALNIAKSIGYKGSGDLESLTEFYINAKSDVLAAKSLNFFLPNGTFGFAPCIENKIENVEPFLTESPLDIIKKGDYKKVPILTGFANMEGISKTLKFDTFSKGMNEDMSNFLPADLYFDNDDSKQNVIRDVKAKYFNNEEITLDNIQGYVDYYSDSMFKYSILKSADLHAENSKKPVYLYEFAFVGTQNMKHEYMERVKGASHRDQSSYILDFFSFISELDDLDIRDRLTSLWTDFVKFEDPTRYESPVVTFKWPKYSKQEPYYLHIDVKTEPRKNMPQDGFNFWDKIYDKYYWTPKAPVPPKIQEKNTADDAIKNVKSGKFENTETTLNQNKMNNKKKIS